MGKNYKRKRKVISMMDAVLTSMIEFLEAAEQDYTPTAIDIVSQSLATAILVDVSLEHIGDAVSEGAWDLFTEQIEDETIFMEYLEHSGLSAFLETPTIDIKEAAAYALATELGTLIHEMLAAAGGEVSSSLIC